MDEVARAAPRAPAVLRPLVVPAVFGAAGAMVAVAWGSRVYGSYWERRILDLPEVLLLGRRIVAEFLVVSAVVLLLWNRRRAARAAIASAVALFALVHYAQFRSAVLSNDLLTATVLRMAEMAEYAVTGDVLATAAGWMILAAMVASSVAASAGVGVLSVPERCLAAAAVLAVASLLALVPALHAERVLSADHGLRPRSPAAEFVGAVTDLLAAPSRAASVSLSEADRSLALEYGIEIREDAVTPILRDHLYRDPLPFPRSRVVPRPHLVVIFAESLSADLLDPYREGPGGLTPEIARMASVSMRVDEYYNHGMPTIRGLRGQLCGVFTGYGHEAWRDAPAKLLSSKMRCMPHLLSEQGYRSVYLSPAPRNEVRVESQFVDFGFDELHFRKAVVGHFLDGEPFGRKGMPSDRQMFRALVSLLEGRDRNRPLFAAISTVETHTGWDVGADGVRYGDGKNRVLNTFHNLDASFGEFWRWFERSPWYEDTIVVLTGDHVLWPHDEARRAAGTARELHDVDRMGLLVYDPTHALPATFRASTSSIDLAPSLLQLLEVPDSSNAFAGWSLFSDRSRFRGGPGQGEFKELLRWEEGRPVVDEVTLEGCEDPSARDSHACSLLRVVTYLQSLEVENRLWRGD